jgi:uncharacterized protein (DUF1778 family)
MLDRAATLSHLATNTFIRSMALEAAERVINAHNAGIKYEELAAEKIRNAPAPSKAAQPAKRENDRDAERKRREEATEKRARELYKEQKDDHEDLVGKTQAEALDHIKEVLRAKRGWDENYDDII